MSDQEEIPHLTDEQWKPIDTLILERRIIQAIKLLRETAGVHLHTAMDMQSSRYDYLRQHRPDDFTCSDEDYWVGVYS